MKTSQKVKVWFEKQEENCCCRSCEILIEESGFDEYDKTMECIDCTQRNLIAYLEDQERIQ